MNKNIYYRVNAPEWSETACITLSNYSDEVDDDYDVNAEIVEEFESDFPQYNLMEEEEGVYSVTDKEDEPVSPKELKALLKNNPKYKLGRWLDY